MRSGGQRQFTLNAATPTSDNSHFAEATNLTSLENFDIFVQKFLRFKIAMNKIEKYETSTTLP